MQLLLFKNLFRMSVRTIDEAEKSETDPEDDPASHILDVKDYEAIFMPNRSCKCIMFIHSFTVVFVIFSH